MYLIERLCHTQLAHEIKTYHVQILMNISHSVNSLSQNISMFKFFKFNSLCHTWLTREVKTLACSNFNN